MSEVGFIQSLNSTLSCQSELNYSELIAWKSNVTNQDKAKINQRQNSVKHIWHWTISFTGCIILWVTPKGSFDFLSGHFLELRFVLCCWNGGRGNGGRCSGGGLTAMYLIYRWVKYLFTINNWLWRGIPPICILNYWVFSLDNCIYFRVLVSDRTTVNFPFRLHFSSCFSHDMAPFMLTLLIPIITNPSQMYIHCQEWWSEFSCLKELTKKGTKSGSHCILFLKRNWR